jgi:23S rRNA (guanosine2251-2'-O)-methyltransferase
LRKKQNPSARKNRHSDLSQKVFVKTEEHLSLLIKDKKDPFLLVLDEIQDPHNLGACLRSADAAGVDAVIVPKDRAVSLTQTVRKIACGAAENVMFIQVTNLAMCLRNLKDQGVWVVGTSDRGDKSIYEVDLKGPLAIIIGSEATGIRRLTKDLCDFLVSIPMSGKVECLNASVATGVCLFEAVRQRIKK